MIPLSIVIGLLSLHTFADFVLQTDKMALNKSKSNYWLFVHVFAYSLCLWPVSLLLGWRGGALFVLLNFAAHFTTDYVTSRVTTRLWKGGRRHAFFVVIGIDQALHLGVLFWSYWWIGGLK
jgi:hypothetical protein